MLSTSNGCKERRVSAHSIFPRWPQCSQQKLQQPVPVATATTLHRATALHRVVVLNRGEVLHRARFLHRAPVLQRPRGPPLTFPRGRPETSQQLAKRHEATGGAVHFLACTEHQWVTCKLMIFFLLCVSPFGAGMPNPEEHLGFNLVYQKCSPQNYKTVGGSGWVQSWLGGSCSKYPPPPLINEAWSGFRGESM